MLPAACGFVGATVSFAVSVQGVRRVVKIFSWNVNGIRSVIRKGALQGLIAAHDPDILCLQETKAERGQAVDLPEYEEYWSSAEKKGYSGTAIFARKRALTVESALADAIAERHGLTADDYGDPVREGRVVTAEFARFYVVSVYTPNSKRELTRLALRHKQWDPAFLEHCQVLEAHKPVIFCGDLNVAHTEDDLANPKSNEGKHGFTQEEREGFQKFIDAGYVDTFRMFNHGKGHYTWWTNRAQARARNVGWRIDYILASSALRNRVRAAAIHPEIMGSDHCPVSVELALQL
jgi:exodeoxyribonuclease III